ncbi:MAG: hypothetical protein IJ525_05370 [Alphaproteobacteria bacterium]|nr:hypothetical protein [Alphaproteobacteria bacterium]
MVSKAALEQAELLAAIKKRGDEQVHKELNAEKRRGLFMLMFALIWVIIKTVFSLGKIILDEVNKNNFGRYE